MAIIRPFWLKHILKERKNLYEIKIKQLKEHPDANLELANGIRELLKEVHDRKDVAAKLKDLHTKVYQYIGQNVCYMRNLSLYITGNYELVQS